jgi:hypothetical protein
MMTMSQGIKNFKKESWAMVPIILATQEAEIRMIMV